MKNKSKGFALLFIALTLSFTTSPIGCSPSTASTEEQRLTQDLYACLIDYTIELAQAEQIWKDSLARASEALKAGGITTAKFRQQAYEINLIYANTVKYIDSRPEYSILLSIMWDGAPPDLAWPLPEFSYDDPVGEMRAEEYIGVYIGFHAVTTEEFLKLLMNRADEQGIELTYTP